MKEPDYKPEVTPMDGNAFTILGVARAALKRAGADKEFIDKYTQEATAGDYDNLLQVTMQYVDLVV